MRKAGINEVQEESSEAEAVYKDMIVKQMLVVGRSLLITS